MELIGIYLYVHIYMRCHQGRGNKEENFDRWSRIEVVHALKFDNIMALETRYIAQTPFQTG